MRALVALVILCGAILMASCSRESDAPHPPDVDPAPGLVLNPLTPEEERVILHKGTEAPFSGPYASLKDEGLYACKRCGAALYRSQDKFDSRCGWPSFDDEIPRAVRRLPDADGRRTEILCARCGAHLGHVFLGEGFTPKDTRHCVNSISLRFIPAPSAAAAGRALFAGGCFWGMEYHFRRVPGVRDVRVGYAGGHKERPTYKEVCSGRTGHLETIEVLFDPARTSFEELARLFFEIHDPAQADGQGPDIGPQYRSAIFCLDDEQRRTAERLIARLRETGILPATELRPAAPFWPAEDYHQRYYERTGGAPYCHIRVKRF